MEGGLSLFKPTSAALTTVTPDAADLVATAAQQRSGDDASPAPLGRAGSDAHTPPSPFGADSQAGERGPGSADDEQSDSAFEAPPPPCELLAGLSAADAEAARQHHLLRHSLPSEQRGTGVLAHFGVDSVSEAAKVIKKMSQRDLQAKFKAVYGARTFSNNNNWLRRKLFEAIGLDPAKGAAKKPGAGGGAARRRRAPKPAPKPAAPRLHRRSRADVEEDNRSAAEALLALGDLAADLLQYGDDEAEDEEEEDGAAAMDAEASDGCVPAGSGRAPRAWSPDAADAAASRGVPPSPARRAPAVEFRVPAPIRVKVAQAAAPSPPPASMVAMFEWAARMQHPAMAAMMAGHPMLGGLPAAHHAQLGLMHAMMLSGPPPPELYQRLMHDSAQQQAHPMAAWMQSMAVAGGAPLSGHTPMPRAPPLFSGGK
jgi:hypothetical protein